MIEVLNWFAVSGWRVAGLCVVLLCFGAALRR